MNLAMARGELHGRAPHLGELTRQARPPRFVTAGSISDADRRAQGSRFAACATPQRLVAGHAVYEPIARFMSLSLTITRTLGGAPGVPEERVRLLRRAFDETMRDPAFLADAERLGSEIDPMGGEEVQHAVTQIMATPKDVVDRTQAIIAGAGF